MAEKPEENKKKESQFYPPHNISTRTLKLWAAHAKTPEARKAFTDMIPKPQRKY